LIRRQTRLSRGVKSILVTGITVTLNNNNSSKHLSIVASKGSRRRFCLNDTLTGTAGANKWWRGNDPIKGAGVPISL
jgi:hypothetical protein